MSTQLTFQASPNLDRPLGFNITHDNALIALAFSSRTRDPPAFSIGIDVMKLRIPGKESFPSFVRTVGDQVRIKLHGRRSTTYKVHVAHCPRTSPHILRGVHGGELAKILLDVDYEGGIHQSPGCWSRVRF